MPVHDSRIRQAFLALALDTPGSRITLALLFAVVLSLLGCGGTDPVDSTPRLLTADPGSGTAGTMVVLTGADFQPGCRVAFGALPAAVVTYVSSNTLLAFAPDGVGPDGVYSIRVTNPSGKSDQLIDAFRGVRPELDVVNGVTRPSGRPGSAVLFEGHAFGDLLGNGRVYFTGPGSRPVEARVSLDTDWNNEVIVSEVPANAVSGPVWVVTSTGSSRGIRFTVEGESPGELHESFRASVLGTLGALPTERVNHGLAIATPRNALLDAVGAGHLYIVGGLDSRGRARRTVYRAPIHPDRSVGTWTAELELPQGLHSMGIVVGRSWIYLAGGVTEAGAPTANVYRARIHRDGSLGLWEVQPSLPTPRADLSLANRGGVLYALAGDPGTTGPGSDGMRVGRAEAAYSHEIAPQTGELLGDWEERSEP